MKKNKNIRGLIIFLVLLGLFIVLSILFFNYSEQPTSQNNLNSISTPGVESSARETVQQPIASSDPKFDEISQIDQARMKEIVTGVMQNTILVTPDLKNELRGIFTKYNMTDKEISDFATYGPALAVVYQAYFFLDALKAVSSGSPIKSDARLSFEQESISRGLMTSERIKANDEEMNLIANHQPIVGPTGTKVIFTTDSINSTLSNIGLVADRLSELFTSNTALDSGNKQPVSENIDANGGCDDLHGPSVYKTVPQSAGGGAYCDCKPGYTAKLTTTADGTPSSWCTKE